ncbi:MAG: hypothetical protein ACOY0R_09030, partial [Chloroflexota bacterium]
LGDLISVLDLEMRADACPELVEGKRIVSPSITDFTRFPSASKVKVAITALFFFTSTRRFSASYFRLKVSAPMTRVMT